MRRTVEMDFEYQATIPAPPVPLNTLYGLATNNDSVTIDSWRDIWISNAKKNHERAEGSFADSGLGKLYGLYDKQPAIVVGSGPSLAINVEHLKKDCGIPIISCLHNFHYLVDHDVKVDFYVTLDAGEVTVEEVSEGGSKDADYYWERTKEEHLLAFIGANPRLIEKWQGTISWFAAPIPDKAVRDGLDAIEPFHTTVSTGGNVLGACFYIAKAIFGCNPIIFTGADFSFSYTKKFHPWDSKYDKDIGQAMAAVDVWGNKVLTWQSYYNFACWFNHRCHSVPGLYINSTEGGILGAFREGNIASIMQIPLDRAILMYSAYEQMREQCENPKTTELKVLL